MESKKIPQSNDIATILQEGLSLPPLTFSLEEIEPKLENRQRPDALIRAAWGTQNYRFVAEFDRLWSPKALSSLIAQARYYAKPPALYPLVVVPYLPDERLAALEAEQVSGIDLCGNGVVVIPNELLVYRSGQPNQFRSEDEIKNVFRGNSSIVARTFLLKSSYSSVQGLQQEIEARGGKVALATVSKVGKSLEALLIIQRNPTVGSASRQLKLLQADKLLELLTSNYEPPNILKTLRGKTKLSREDFQKRLAALRPEVRVLRTGFGSVGAYAVMATEAMQYYYCDNIEAITRSLGDVFEPTERFANITFYETKEEAAYFDGRAELVASPVQAYLELATGDKRAQETAEQLRRAIFQPLLKET